MVTISSSPCTFATSRACVHFVRACARCASVVQDCLRLSAWRAVIRSYKLNCALVDIAPVGIARVSCVTEKPFSVPLVTSCGEEHADGRVYRDLNAYTTLALCVGHWQQPKAVPGFCACRCLRLSRPSRCRNGIAKIQLFSSPVNPGELKGCMLRSLPRVHMNCVNVLSTNALRNLYTFACGVSRTAFGLLGTIIAIYGGVSEGDSPSRVYIPL